MFISFARPGFITKYGCHKHDPRKIIYFTITKKTGNPGTGGHVTGSTLIIYIVSRCQYFQCSFLHATPIHLFPKSAKSHFFAIASPCSTSWQLPCTSHAHEFNSNGPHCQDLEQGQDDPSCWQTCQQDGLLGYV